MHHQHYGEERRWQATLAIAAALLLYWRLPPRVVVGPVWLLPVFVLVILVPLLISRSRFREETRWQRVMGIGVVVVLNAFNLATIALLVIWQFSEHHKRPIGGEDLLRTAVNIWITNLIVYALWYWEIDGGGPDARQHTPIDLELQRSDFLFPQMSLDQDVREKLRWKPHYVDYLFLAFTNATAFSPADTFPLTQRGKLLMMLEAMASLLTITIFAARAVGMIGS